MANSMSITNARRLGKLLHPARQEMVVAEVVELNETTKMYTLKSAAGRELAYFEAGCYIPVFVELDGNVVERPYGISSSPREAEQGVYKIVVKQAVGGYVSTHILEHWKVGDAVVLGSPREADVHVPLRDGNRIIALAGGVGITPFHSMAKAVAEGDGDYELCLFYGANTADELLYRDEWDALVEMAGGKLRVVPVIANEEVEGCESGFITLDIIKRHADVEGATFFICGPGPMVEAMKRELAPLELPRRRTRISMIGDSEFNHRQASGEAFQITVHMGGETYQVPAPASETILVAIEKAGLQPAVMCRSGVCGFCRSMLVSGDFTLATEETGVRFMDKHFGFIHPCCSYPASDMELVVQRA